MKSLPYNDPKSPYVTNTDTEIFFGSENNLSPLNTKKKLQSM